jgi:hypothetical protein
MVKEYTLSYDLVELDYSLLIETAQIAVRLAKDTLNRNLNKWFDSNQYPISPTYIEIMLSDAKSLASASITLYALEEGKDRTKKVIKEEAKQ